MIGEIIGQRIVGNILLRKHIAVVYMKITIITAKDGFAPRLNGYLFTKRIRIIYLYGMISVSSIVVLLIIRITLQWIVNSFLKHITIKLLIRRIAVFVREGQQLVF